MFHLQIQAQKGIVHLIGIGDAWTCIIIVVQDTLLNFHMKIGFAVVLAATNPMTPIVEKNVFDSVQLCKFVFQFIKSFSFLTCMLKIGFLILSDSQCR